MQTFTSLVFGILLLAGLVFLIIAIKSGISNITKGITNTKYNVNDNEFTQAGISVKFKEKTISINGKTYNANQVTAIRTEPVNYNRNSKAENVIIDLDDFHKPNHRVVFLTEKKADAFVQRLCLALDKTGNSMS